MNRTRISLTAALLSLCLLLSGCMMPPAEGTVTSFSLEDIPAWSAFSSPERTPTRKISSPAPAI